MSLSNSYFLLRSLTHRSATQRSTTHRGTLVHTHLDLWRRSHSHGHGLFGLHSHGDLLAHGRLPVLIVGVGLLHLRVHRDASDWLLTVVRHAHRLLLWRHSHLLIHRLLLHGLLLHVGSLVLLRHLVGVRRLHRLLLHRLLLPV